MEELLFAYSLSEQLWQRTVQCLIQTGSRQKCEGWLDVRGWAAPDVATYYDSLETAGGPLAGAGKDAGHSTVLPAPYYSRGDLDAATY